MSDPMASSPSSSSSSSATRFTVPLFIGGREIHTTQTFDVVSPLDGQPVHQCCAATLQDAASAVDAAAAAFPTWRRTTPSQRRDLLLRTADIITRRGKELAQCVISETGASRSWAEADVSHVVEMLKDTAGRIAAIEGSFPALADPDTSAIVMREPYGVVLAIAPWNAPLILGIRALLFPLAAGNTVVFKASEASPRCSWGLVSALREAGLPAGAVNLIIHQRADAAAATTALIANPLVKKVNFTGSTPVGRAVARVAGEHLEPILLELGGKAPAIVWEDADLQLAAKKCAMGAFLHSGQICMSTERILVHTSIKQQFVHEFKTAVDKAFPSGAEAPTLISSASVEKNKNLVADAASRGASVIHGDAETAELSATRLRPIVVDKVTPEMDIYATESFGPTVSLIEIDSEEEAIRIANDTEAGLSAAVFTHDLQRGLRLARQLETGAVHINSMTVHDEAVLPHGGAKASGYGRFNARLGLEEWVRTKNVTFRMEGSWPGADDAQLAALGGEKNVLNSS